LYENSGLKNKIQQLQAKNMKLKQTLNKTNLGMGEGGGLRSLEDA